MAAITIKLTTETPNINSTKADISKANSSNILFSRLYTIVIKTNSLLKAIFIQPNQCEVSALVALFLVALFLVNGNGMLPLYLVFTVKINKQLKQYG